jgi:hypothetical protein
MWTYSTPDRDGETVKIDQLSPIRKSLLVRPEKIMSGQCVKSDGVLALRLDKHFSGEGVYILRAVLHSADGHEDIWSNSLTISVAEPTGSNRYAYDFLKQTENLFLLF